MKILQLLFVLVVVLSLAARGVGQDGELAWPQFRGPGGSGVADAENPPVEIGPDKNVKWKVAVPSGASSPIVARDMLVLTAFENNKLYTIAYSRADGSEVWRGEAPATEIEKFNEQEGSPAASTPATDGERIVSYFGSCGLVAHDLAGNELWRVEMPPAQTMGNFGSGVSPIIADGMVVLLRDVSNGSKIIAIDAATGDVKWEKERQSMVGYCTPAVWDTPEGKQVAAPGNNRMIGYDLRTGEEKWYVVGMPSASCASPVATGDDLYFAAWAPGATNDPDPANRMPTFDQLLAGEGGDKDGDGAISAEEAKSGPMAGFFDVQDANGDGKLTRDEWDAMMKMMAAGVNSAFALEPGGTGDVTETHVRWKQTKGLPYVPTAIVYRGQHVMINSIGVVTAYDTTTGAELYQKRTIGGTSYASPVAAGGNIYFTSLADGAVTVLEGGSPQPRIIAKNASLGERTAATPAIADDTLYIRTAGHLYAFAAADGIARP